MNHEITSMESLRAILKQYTKSEKVSHRLNGLCYSYLCKPARGETIYFTYSRGPSTLMFGRGLSIEQDLYLIEIWDKHTVRPDIDGLSYNLLMQVLPLIQRGGNLITHRDGLYLELDGPLSEIEVTKFFKLGFTMYDYNSYGAVNHPRLWLNI